MSKPKSYWNYRILTRIIKDKNTHVVSKQWREFFIAEVFYKKGKPSGYKDADINPLAGWDSLKNLEWTAKHIKDALKKPVLDADNFPKKWKDGKHE